MKGTALLGMRPAPTIHQSQASGPALKPPPDGAHPRRRIGLAPRRFGLAPMTTLLALASACSKDMELPTHVYIDALTGPAVTQDGYLISEWYNSLDITDNAKRISKIDVADATGAVLASAFVDEPGFAAAAIGNDGFTLVAHDGALKVLDRGLAPWYEVRLSGSAVASVPAVGPNDETYVGTALGLVSAFDGDGNPLWTTDAGGAVVGRHSLDREGRLFVLSGEDGVSALESATGALLYRVDLGAHWISPVAIGKDDTFYVVAYLGDPDLGLDRALYRLRAYASADGALLWEEDLGGLTLAPSVTPRGDLIVSVAETPDGAAALYKLDADGEIRWTYDADSFYGRPTLTTHGILVGCGVALCLISDRGRLEATLGSEGYGIPFAPVAHDGTIVAWADGVMVGWAYGGGIHTLDEGWPLYGGDNHRSGRAP